MGGGYHLVFPIHIAFEGLGACDTRHGETRNIQVETPAPESLRLVVPGHLGRSRRPLKPTFWRVNITDVSDYKLYIDI